MARHKKTGFVLMSVMLFIHVAIAQDRIDKHCNPSLKHRFEDCPKGYCCVRDEFLPSYVYCRKIGQVDENCTTKETDSECPCDKGLYCKANIASSFLSLYGRCYNATKDATTTSTTMGVTSDPTPSSPATTTPMKGDNSITTTDQTMTGDTVQKFVTTPVTSKDDPSTRPLVDFPKPIIG